MHVKRGLAAAAAAVALALTGCSTTSTPAEKSPQAADAEGALVIYSGRNEKLIGPLLEKLEKHVGRKVEIHYAGTPQTAAKLLEEGKNSPADLFISQDAGALGELKNAGALKVLDKEILDKVPAFYRDKDNKWVATSGRSRVLAYSSAAPEVASMKSIDKIVDPKYKGKIGYAPKNASFQSFVTALRVVKGEEGAEKWLKDLKALEPKTYEKNTAVLEGVEKNEVSIGLINHYYWYKLVAEKGADKVTSKLAFMDNKDAGGLVNVAGAAILESSKRPAAAAKTIDFLLSKEGQTYFADQTAEYPVIDGVKSTKFNLAPLDVKAEHVVDLNQLDSLKKTQELLAKVGMI